MTDFAVLSGIGYNVTVADRQVIFENSEVWGCHTQFAFERPPDLNNTPGIWYFVSLDSSSNRVPASHLVKAHEWCCETFGASFTPYLHPL